MQERIQKNINLLSLEGKPAPALEAAVWFGPQPPSIASLRGKAVLLFFWAHWCPDCKADVPIIAGLMKKYGPQGLALIGPTEYYGYVANGADAPPEVEKPYIEHPPPVLRAAGRYARAFEQCEFRALWREFDADAGSGGSQGNRELVPSGRATEQELTAQIERALR